MFKCAESNCKVNAEYLCRIHPTNYFCSNHFLLHKQIPEVHEQIRISDRRQSIREIISNSNALIKDFESKLILTSKTKVHSIWSKAKALLGRLRHSKAALYEVLLKEDLSSHVEEEIERLKVIKEECQELSFDEVPEAPTVVNQKFVFDSFFKEFEGIPIFYHEMLRVGQEGSYTGFTTTGNIKSMIGTFHYSNGDVYEGGWKGNKRHSKGTLRLANGESYEGEWSEGMKQGNGVYRYIEGRVYEGSWLSDRKQGKGIMKFPDGSSYKGELDRDNKSGYGEKDYADGRRYKGRWLSNKKHGTGKMLFADGSIYDEAGNSTSELAKEIILNQTEALMKAAG